MMFNVKKKINIKQNLNPCPCPASRKTKFCTKKVLICFIHCVMALKGSGPVDTTAAADDPSGFFLVSAHFKDAFCDSSS